MVHYYWKSKTPVDTLFHLSYTKNINSEGKETSDTQNLETEEVHILTMKSQPWLRTSACFNVNWQIKQMWMSEERLDKLRGTSVHHLVKAMDIISPYDSTTAWNKNKPKAVHWSDRNKRAHTLDHDALDKLLY